MSRRALIVCLLLALPYAYVTFYWARLIIACRECSISGDMIFLTLALLFATPIVLIIAGGTAFWSARKGAAASLERGDYAGAAKSGGCAYFGLRSLVSGAVLLAAGLWLLLDAPEPGRDRLGRICEESPNGSSVRCRPDPDRKTSTLDQINEARGKERWR